MAPDDHHPPIRAINGDADWLAKNQKPVNEDQA
jgi:hypothetical protein